MIPTHQQILTLLCQSKPEAIAQAKQLAQESGADIDALLRDEGYNDVGILNPEDFYLEELLCPDKELEKLPELLPASLWRINCAYNRLQKLPERLPPNLKHLNCSNNQLQSLPEQLPDNLEHIYCDFNQLRALPERLPARLRSAYFSYNQLQTLPKRWPEELRMLFLAQNQLQTLPEQLPDTLLKLVVIKNQLQQLPPRLPAGLQSLFCTQNLLRQLPDSLPPKLLRLECSNNQLQALPANLPQSIKRLTCQKNQLRGLPAQLPAQLQSLNCSQNQLEQLPEQWPEGLEVLELSGNLLQALPELPAKLKRLFVSNNLLQKLEMLPPRLEKLKLDRNPLQTLPQDWPNSLQQIDIYQTKVQIPNNLPQQLTECWSADKSLHQQNFIPSITQFNRWWRKSYQLLDNTEAVINLLCAGDSHNVELAELLCQSQGWDIFQIIRDYQFPHAGLSKPVDFLSKQLTVYSQCFYMPAKLPDSIEKLRLKGSRLRRLPEQWPSKLHYLDCSDHHKLERWPDSWPIRLQTIIFTFLPRLGMPTLPPSVKECRVFNLERKYFPLLEQQQFSLDSSGWWQR